MAGTGKMSALGRIACVVGAAVVGFFAAWIALDASQTSGRYWPIHLVSGPVFSLANNLHEMHYGVMTMVGTGALFGVYALVATSLRGWATAAVIALIHVGVGVACVVAKVGMS